MKIRYYWVDRSSDEKFMRRVLVVGGRHIGIEHSFQDFGASIEKMCASLELSVLDNHNAGDVMRQCHNQVVFSIDDRGITDHRKKLDAKRGALA